MGSFGYVSPYLRYEQSFSKAFAVSAVAEYIYAENDYPYEIRNVKTVTKDRRTNSLMSSGHGELNFSWQPHATNRLTGKIYYYDNSRQLPGIVHYYTNVSGETLHDRNFFVQAGYQKRWGDTWALKTIAKVNWYESIYRDKLMPGAVNDASYWQREYYASAALLFVPTKHWAMDYSADYSFNNLNGSSWRAIIGHPFRHSILQSVTVKYQTGRLVMTGKLLHSLFINRQKNVEQTDRTDVQINSARNMRRLSPSLSL